MSRGGTRGHTRVRTGRGRTSQSIRWLERQLNDPYVKRAKAEGYRSRAAYKLIELDEKFDMLKGAKRVVDLGCGGGIRGGGNTGVEGAGRQQQRRRQQTTATRHLQRPRPKTAVGVWGRGGELRPLRIAVSRTERRAD